MKFSEREGVNNNRVLSDSMGIAIQVQFCEGFGDYWEARVDLGSTMPSSCETAESMPGCPKGPAGCSTAPVILLVCFPKGCAPLWPSLIKSVQTDGFGPAERKENHRWVRTGAVQPKEKMSGGGGLQPRQGFLPEQEGMKCLSYLGHIRF